MKNLSGVPSCFTNNAVIPAKEEEQSNSNKQFTGAHTFLFGTMAWLAFWLLLLLFALVVAAAAARDGDGRVEYKVDAGWPKGMPANATRFTAAATTTRRQGEQRV